MSVLPMGSGKTGAALTAIEEMIEQNVIRHALILAPKRVAQLVWPDEIHLWEHTQDLDYELLNGDPKKRTKLMGSSISRDLTIIGIDNTQWLVEQLEKLPDEHPLFDLLVIDEVSRFRNPKSKRGRALISQAKRFKNIWALTGTPRPNGLYDLFKPLQIVTRDALWGKSYYKWRDQRFYPLDYMQRDWEIRPEWEERTNLEAATVSSTLAPEDMPELPELTIVEHNVRMSTEAWGAYSQMAKELIAVLRSTTVTAANAGVASGKLSQAAQGFMYDNDKVVRTLHTAKRDWVEEMVEDLAGDPVIIVYEFHEDLAVLKELFGDDTPHLGSGVDDKTAAKNVENWNAKKLPILLMQSVAGSHGLNLQHGGNQMIFYGLTWSSESYEQMLKRIHRPGQTERCFVHICLAEGTIDVAKRFRVLLKMTKQEAFSEWLKKI